MISAVGVIVPARNERARIGPCLAALATARDHAFDRFAIPIRILVVLDSCTDDTAEQIRADLGIDTVTCQHRSVGAARALGATTVLNVLNDAGHRRESTWLANTDADSRVPLDWLTHMIDVGNAGAHLALGTVRPDLAADTPAFHRWSREYIPHDGHPHIHGANLGIRADTYLELGGWPPVTHDEDVELVLRATASTGLCIVRTASVPVVTSARYSGRTPAGFAHYMSHLHTRGPSTELVPVSDLSRSDLTRSDLSRSDLSRSDLPRGLVNRDPCV